VLLMEGTIKRSGSARGEVIRRILIIHSDTRRDEDDEAIKSKDLKFRQSVN